MPPNYIRKIAANEVRRHEMEYHGKSLTDYCNLLKSLHAGKDVPFSSEISWPFWASIDIPIPHKVYQETCRDCPCKYYRQRKYYCGLFGPNDTTPANIYHEFWKSKMI